MANSMPPGRTKTVRYRECTPDVLPGKCFDLANDRSPALA
jgi:hypothetical protein